MSSSIKISDALLTDAKRYASLYSRSVPKQIEFWSHIGKIAEENPDLPYSFIKQILLGREEAADGEVSDYEFD